MDYTQSRILNTYQRFLSSKGFDYTDDLEFCPQILPLQNGNTPRTTSSPNTNNLIFSPNTTSSTTTTNNINSNTTTSSPVSNSPTQQIKAKKKILDIVNPHTGLSVTMSPKPHPI